MRFTRPGADQTPAGAEPNASEKACVTVEPADVTVEPVGAADAGGVGNGSVGNGGVGDGGVGNSAHLPETGCYPLG